MYPSTSLKVLLVSALPFPTGYFCLWINESDIKVTYHFCAKQFSKEYTIGDDWVSWWYFGPLVTTYASASLLKFLLNR